MMIRNERSVHSRQTRKSRIGAAPPPALAGGQPLRRPLSSGLITEAGTWAQAMSGP